MRCWKLVFKTKKEAKQKKRRFEDKFGKKLTLYYCNKCVWYHYTTANPEKRSYLRKSRHSDDYNAQ